MTPDERQAGVRDSALIAATETFVSSLKALGVETFIIGYAIQENPKGEGVTRLAGNATIVLNLLCAVIKALRPEDFHNLALEMLGGKYFEAQRQDLKDKEAPKVEGYTEEKKGWVN